MAGIKGDVFFIARADLWDSRKIMCKGEISKERSLPTNTGGDFGSHCFVDCKLKSEMKRSDPQRTKLTDIESKVSQRGSAGSSWSYLHKKPITDRAVPKL